MVTRRDFIKTGAAAWGVTALGPLAGCMNPGTRQYLSVAAFASPPLAARPMVLWPWLNGYVNLGQITRELEEMKAKGLRGPIIWDVGAIIDPQQLIPTGPPFLGEESVEAIGHALREASRLGLEVGLFASSSWNAGGPWIEPEMASRQLAWSETAAKGPGPATLDLPIPEDLKAPFVEVGVVAVPGEGSSAEPIDLSGSLNADGRLEWDVPAGDWTVLRFVCGGTGQPLEIPSPASNGPMIDHMSLEATDRHFGEIFGRLAGLGPERQALKLMMLDSFEVWDRPDWTPAFLDVFRAEFGYDPVPFLPILAGRETFSAETSARFLHDYRVLVSRLMIRNHFVRSAELLEQQGMLLLAEAGHGGYARVDPLEGLGVAHIPMGEFWNGSQFWVTKEAASAAHIYGRPDVAAESLTGWRHWKDGPTEYKRLFDIGFCAGLTMGVFHTFAHNPPEAGKPGFAYHAGEHFNVNSTWWEHAGPFVEYLSRCSHLLRQGRFVADVCFYYGDQAPNLVPSRRIDPKVAPPHPEGTCQHCGRPMPNRIESLGPGYDFDYVNRDIVVNDMQVRSGRLVLSSGMEYRMIVLPDRDDIALPVLRRLEELVRDGATLVGRPPQRANSLEDYPGCDDEVRRISSLLWGAEPAAGPHPYGAGRVHGDVNLRDLLAGMGARPDFTVESPAQHAVDYIHRRTDGEDLYFVTNSADDPVRVECAFRVDGGVRPWFWHPVDGSVTPCTDFRRGADGLVRLAIELPPVGSVFVVFAPGDEDAAGLITARDARDDAGRTSAPGGEEEPGRIPTPDALEWPISGPWTLSFPDGAGAPAAIALDELFSWPELEPQGARVFSGTARYSTTVVVPASLLAEGRVVVLDLGRVAEVARLHVNGSEVATLWCPPFRADVSSHLQAGPNLVEIEVTNTWHNRIVGDLRYPEAGEFARTNIKNRFRADMELLPSGLLGPVRLLSTTG